MSQVKCISLAVVAVLCLLSGQTMAANKPLSCVDAPSMNFSTTQLSGVWYEVARNPAFNNPINCIEVDIGMLPGNTKMGVNLTYADFYDNLNMNLTHTGSFTLNSSNISTAGYNITFTLPTIHLTNVTYKLLATDYTSYAFVCGYSNAKDNSTAFGVVMTRQRTPSVTVLNNFEVMAAANYSNFLNGSMSTIIQTAACYTNNSSAAVPFMAAILAAIYAVLKFIN